MLSLPLQRLDIDANPIAMQIIFDRICQIDPATLGGAAPMVAKDRVFCNDKSGINFLIRKHPVRGVESR